MITLDEAIEILSRPKTMKGTPQDILEAHDMAIAALRQSNIIYCRDCVWHSGNHVCRNKDSIPWNDDDFCSWAERREVSE